MKHAFLAAVAALGLGATSASAITYSFEDLLPGGGGSLIASEFSLDVTAIDAGVIFSIMNDVAVSEYSPRGRSVGFEDSLGLLTNPMISGTNVSFATANGNLPQSNRNYDEFVFAATQGNDSATIGDGETLDLTFELNGTTTFDDVIAALNSGSLLVGLHVISINGVDPSSDTITTIGEVPLPAGLPLLLAGVGAFGLMRRKRKAA
ncbi:VPLPA-CTERM sorting domain-containing protein [Palleronia sp. LCG004]|uniref:VPLPA-CTERM sorting domain-containing protein n=1 Tax=Palleronia sp. LCG004 TaxID=3079304 RepID=UPI0029422347|nr:VPLPA-CTERM sorting domain-containing protein [Palleronia sp. LCG004]WOI56872.1 VPLPA-CTERM sorting domain-containing protein [Palleronia sp. LCG004]